MFNIKKKIQPKKLPVTENKELNEVFERIKEKKRKQEERKRIMTIILTN